MVNPVAPLYQVFVTSIPPPAELHTDIYKLDWPACSLALFKTGLGFFLVIECSPRQQVFSCQSLNGHHWEVYLLNNAEYFTSIGTSVILLQINLTESRIASS